MSARRANIGCGQTPTEGWRNFDNSPSIRLAATPVLPDLLARIGLLGAPSYRFVQFARTHRIELMNAAKPWPLADDSLEVIYSSHMVEHFDPSEARTFLVEAHRVLAPGGILRLALPDLERLIENYVRERDADAFMSSLHVCSPRQTSLAARAGLFLYGNRRHNWMYDARSLLRLVSASGFTDVRSLPPGETTIPDPGALDLAERESESIYIEARKPRPV